MIGSNHQGRRLPQSSFFQGGSDLANGPVDQRQVVQVIGVGAEREVGAMPVVDREHMRSREVHEYKIHLGIGNFLVGAIADG